MIPVDRDRLRSVQELRCANCILGVAHCAKRCPADARIWLFWRFERQFRKSGGGATGRSPQGRGRTLPRASESASGRRLLSGSGGQL